VFKFQGAAVLAFALSACTTVPPTPPAQPQAASPPSSPAAGGARYRLDPDQSELRILVYRAGTMAALGHNHVIINRALHNHVIINRALSGWVVVAGTPAGGMPPSGMPAGGMPPTGTPAAASFALTVPTSAFIVDDASARAEEGEEFSQAVPEDAKAGTLRNMLSPAVLDAAEFPDITVQSETVIDARTELEATVAVKVAGHESTLHVPFTLSNADGRLTATGSVAVRQTAIGLVPLSVFLGAIRVQDEMRVKFKFVATADQGSGSGSSNIDVPSGAINNAAPR
jgi:YceI-like domain